MNRITSCLQMNNSIVTITNNPVIDSLIKFRFENIHKIAIFRDIKSAIDYIYTFFPNLLIADITQPNQSIMRIINDLKGDSIFGQISILLIIPDDFVISSWEDLLADDFIRYADLENDINIRVELCLLRSRRMVEVNPLTRIPGNITIIREIQQRIEKNETFAVAYADLDYFKPFNDKYGFSRGDEVIKMLGRLIYNTIKENQPLGSFVGHIGGDDFIYIMDVNLIENTSNLIIENYDKIIPAFYDYADRENNFIESVDREGNEKTFPIMSLSIGITHNKYKRFIHHGEITQILAEMKKYAKSVKGSYFIADRRR